MDKPNCLYQCTLLPVLPLSPNLPYWPLSSTIAWVVYVLPRITSVKFFSLYNNPNLPSSNLDLMYSNLGLLSSKPDVLSLQPDFLYPQPQAPLIQPQSPLHQPDIGAFQNSILNHLAAARWWQICRMLALLVSASAADCLTAKRVCPVGTSYHPLAT